MRLAYNSLLHMALELPLPPVYLGGFEQLIKAHIFVFFVSFYTQGALDA